MECRQKSICRKLPSIADLAQGYLSLGSGKAAGASSLPAELRSADTLGAAGNHPPLLLKAVSFGQALFLCRGVLVAVIPKQPSGVQCVEAWRSIALAKASAKRVCRAVRAVLADHLRKVADGGQGGPLKGSSLSVPAHYVASYVRYAVVQQRAGASLFVDGRAAYYSVLREKLFECGSIDDAEVIRHIVQELRHNKEHQDALLAAIVGPGLLQEAGVPAGVVLVHFLKATLNNTWFTMRVDGPDVFATRAGSTPGSPLADIIFQCLQADFLRDAQTDLQNHGLEVKIGRGTAPAPAPGWADDLAFLVPVCAAAEVQDALCQLVRVVEFRSRGISVYSNCQPGETEACVC